MLITWPGYVTSSSNKGWGGWQLVYYSHFTDGEVEVEKGEMARSESDNPKSLEEPSLETCLADLVRRLALVGGAM